MGAKSFALGLLTGLLLTLALTTAFLLWLKPYLTAGKAGLRVFRGVRSLWRRRRPKAPDLESATATCTSTPPPHNHPPASRPVSETNGKGGRPWHTIELQASSVYAHAAPPRKAFNPLKRANTDSSGGRGVVERGGRQPKPVLARLNTDVASTPPLQRVHSNVEYPRRSQESVRA
ncbi:uncharacterized protein BDZ99DRAFT_479947 [Mytilinidion resinicola]|uniref:Uncharacterized protein n=1 Tax=Mytilinidion resinicola TaxID=574789 RepID=A0A6A6YDK1_9PEZI|nr:uncharacterized protein BDZ99DRAFT_479947 [Mytilinidion resinicola]KAF2805927.1 hypothetical protein BDZ99DRAFT_479947 [Mytilinidion resinicola]